MYETIISAAELSGRLDDPDWLIVDCRFDLGRPEAGAAAYRERHLPGALYAHLDHDLSGPITPGSGRHPLPAPEKFATTLGRWGIAAATQVIAYDADNSMYAARLWWLLRWIGHRRAAVLDGGFKAWLAAGLPTTAAVPVRTATVFQPRPDHNAWVDTRQVAERVQQSDWRLLDARAPDRFRGDVEPIDTIGGHVPGARNHPFMTNLGTDGKFASPTELRVRFEHSQAGAGDDHTIVMCGSGVTACNLLLALEIAGKRGARLYAGSWSEWIRDPARGVAKGGS
jgi:thiosulfate/3-mercaptopyruvate sulfurtransferase